VLLAIFDGHWFRSNCTMETKNINVRSSIDSCSVTKPTKSINLCMPL
jgi:hypothetical protein